MSLSTLPIEFELAAAKILSIHYLHSRFKLTVEIKKEFLIIDLQGYFTDIFDPKNVPDFTAVFPNLKIMSKNQSKIKNNSY